MNKPIVKIHVKNFGTMTAELYPDMAPLTVANFLSLAENGFYEGLIFHRVIPGFMIQGGGYTADMQEREAKSIKGEFLMNGCRTNTLKHTRGVLSMARTSVPDSASSQFFVMHETSPHLDGQYAGFGKVIDGLEVIDKIANVETGNYGWYMQDVPVNTVEIEKIEIVSE